MEGDFFISADESLLELLQVLEKRSDEEVERARGTLVQLARLLGIEVEEKGTREILEELIAKCEELVPEEEVDKTTVPSTLEELIEELGERIKLEEELRQYVEELVGRYQLERKFVVQTIKEVFGEEIKETKEREEVKERNWRLEPSQQQTDFSSERGEIDWQPVLFALHSLVEEVPPQEKEPKKAAPAVSFPFQPQQEEGEKKILPEKKVAAEREGERVERIKSERIKRRFLQRVIAQKWEEQIFPSQKAQTLQQQEDLRPFWEKLAAGMVGLEPELKSGEESGEEKKGRELLLARLSVETVTPNSPQEIVNYLIGELPEPLQGDLERLNPSWKENLFQRVQRVTISPSERPEEKVAERPEEKAEEEEKEQEEERKKGAETGISSQNFFFSFIAKVRQKGGIILSRAEVSFVKVVNFVRFQVFGGKGGSWLKGAISQGFSRGSSWLGRTGATGVRKALGFLGKNAPRLVKGIGAALSRVAAAVAAGAGAPVEGVVIFVVGAVLVAILLIAILAFAVLGSGYRLSRNTGGTGFSSQELSAYLEVEESKLSQLPQREAIKVQRAFLACGITRITATALEENKKCLLKNGVKKRTWEIFLSSARQYDYLQCVGFVMGTVPDFQGGHNAVWYATHSPGGWWRKVENRKKEIDQLAGGLAVWGASSRCGVGETCEENVACCGHIGVIVGVEKGQEGTVDYLYVTQAWGDSGRISTIKVPVDVPTTIYKRG